MKLNRRDSEVLAQWLVNNATLAEVLAAPQIGLVDNERFTIRARERFVYYWIWSCPRFTGHAGELQDEFYRLHGAPGMQRRYERVMRVIAARIRG